MKVVVQRDELLPGGLIVAAVDHFCLRLDAGGKRLELLHGQTARQLLHDAGFQHQPHIEALTQAKEQIDAENETALYSMFEDSRDYRNSMPNSSAGPIKKQFALYCDIIDEAGGIATIATILASNHISIKNIGIIHNREFEEGVLRIEFYDEDSAANASKLLQKYRYVIYEV